MPVWLFGKIVSRRNLEKRPKITKKALLEPLPAPSALASYNFYPLAAGPRSAPHFVLWGPDTYLDIWAPKRGARMEKPPKNSIQSSIVVLLPWSPLLEHCASKFGLNPWITFIGPALEKAARLLGTQHGPLGHRDWSETHWKPAAAGNNQCTSRTQCPQTQ